jgi:anti-sigma B factor antagonist
MPQTLEVSSSAVSPEAVRVRGFACTLRDGGLDAAWVHIVGDLDLATAPALELTLQQAEARAQRVVLDLRELTFIDSAGVHVIVNASIRARAAGRRLVLVRGPARIDRLFALTRMAALLEIVDLHPAQPPVQALVEIAQKDRVA